MIVMVTAVVIAAIGTVVHIASDLFEEESVTRAQETNREKAEGLAERLLSQFQEIGSRVTLMAQFASQSENTTDAENAIKNVIKGDDNIVNFVAYKFDEKGNPITRFLVSSETALAEFKTTAVILRDKAHHRILQEQLKSPDQILVANTSPQFGLPLLSLSLMSKVEVKPAAGPPNNSAPQAAVVTKKDPDHPLAGRWLFRVDFRQDAVMKLFVKKTNLTAFLVDQSGRLMAHSDPSSRPEVLKGSSVVTLPIVEKMLETSLDNHQMEFEDLNGEMQLGAFKRVGVAGVGVVAQISKQKALATVYRVQYRSFLVMIFVVCLAFLINFGFAQSITKPLKLLFAATQKIVEGNFEVDLKSSSSDEVGALSKAFRKMVQGLKERDRLQGAFNKFHSKEIAQKLLSGDIKLGGERKHATIFFSDIRGFTAMSEKMSPDQVVAMLNEYMTEMVRIIYKWNGVVDKYVGDAIMAIWGVPEGKKEDPVNALRASLEMRDFLYEFNKKRVLNNQFEIKIGIGLHSGEVLSGNIGSEQRLEYTVIGDTVNLASRVESTNKATSSDILVSGATALLVEGHGFVLGPPLKVNVKGKANEIVVHQVIGYKSESGTLITTLSEDQIQKIKTQTFVEAHEEEKSHMAPTGGGPKLVPAGFGGSPNLPPISSPGPTPFSQPVGRDWWISTSVSDPQTYGPFTLDEIYLKVRHKQIAYTWFAFQKGDLVRTPVDQLPGLTRKDLPPVNEPLPPMEVISAASSDEWYVYGPQGETLGPLTSEEIRIALQRGNITRTTYVWNKNYENWIYVYQIPGFDRRGPPPPPTGVMPPSGALPPTG